MTLDATNTFLYALRLLARSNISCRRWYQAFFFGLESRIHDESRLDRWV